MLLKSVRAIPENAMPEGNPVTLRGHVWQQYRIDYADCSEVYEHNVTQNTYYKLVEDE